MVAIGALGCSKNAILPPEPTAQEVVAAAVDWVRAEDCLAAGSTVWLFSKGGRSARTSTLLLDGDSLYVNVGWASPQGPAWVRLSAGDFPDEGSVEKAFAGGDGPSALLYLSGVLVSDPLLVLEKAGTDLTLTPSSDGALWEAEGKAGAKDMLQVFLGPIGASRVAVRTNASEVGFRLSVDKASARPVEMVVSPVLGGEVGYRWQRGIWKFAAPEVGSVDEYVGTLAASTTTSSADAFTYYLVPAGAWPPDLGDPGVVAPAQSGEPGPPAVGVGFDGTSTMMLAVDAETQRTLPPR